MPDAPSVAVSRPAPQIRRGLWASRARTLAIAYFILLATATHLPPRTDALLVGSDKLYHFGAYAVLAVVVLAGWELTLGRLEPKHFFGVWLAGTLYGVIDELTQIPVGRDGDVHDWMFDVLGVTCGLAAYLLVRRLWLAKSSPTPPTDQ